MQEICELRARNCLVQPRNPKKLTRSRNWVHQPPIRGFECRDLRISPNASETASFSGFLTRCRSSASRLEVRLGVPSSQLLQRFTQSRVFELFSPQLEDSAFSQVFSGSLAPKAAITAATAGRIEVRKLQTPPGQLANSLRQCTRA